jgi:hypothetical protein
MAPARSYLCGDEVTLWAKNVSENRFFQGGIPAADDKNVLIAREKAVASPRRKTPGR